VSARGFFLIASISGLLAVAMGAFGSHLLKDRLAPELFAVFEVAVRYQMYHSLALLAASWACAQWPSPWTGWAAWLFVAGLLFFSGSLYLLSLTGWRWPGAVAPLGGLCLMAGWVCLALAAWKS
jgi:uncharacterized membrane protein YgdD (TMEM256/DUF423 family)